VVSRDIRDDEMRRDAAADIQTYRDEKNRYERAWSDVIINITVPANFRWLTHFLIYTPELDIISPTEPAAIGHSDFGFRMQSGDTSPCGQRDKRLIGLDNALKDGLSSILNVNLSEDQWN